jgi:hypothetical protein
MSERLPAPWKVTQTGECYLVSAANEQPIVYLHFDDPPRPDRAGGARLSRDLARRVALNIAKLPDLLRARGQTGPAEPIPFPTDLRIDEHDVARSRPSDCKRGAACAFRVKPW